MSRHATTPENGRRTGGRTLLRSLVAGLTGAAILGSGAGIAQADTATAPVAAKAARTVTASVVPMRPVGVQFHGMWQNYTDAQRAHVLDQFRAAGVRQVRLDVSWIMLQPNGPTSFDSWGTQFVDRVITMANQRGIKPLVTLWLTPGWANSNRGDRALPNNPGDYARVARWSATRWRGKVAGWEVWNEQNDPGFMTGADPVAYTKLLRAAYPAFKAGDPAAPVVYGGLQYNDDAWLARSYAAGAKGYFDVMATHPYQGVADADPTVRDDGTKWTLTHVAAIRNLMVAKGDGAKKVWFTEFGWSTHATAPGAPNFQRGVSEATQALFLQKTAALVAERYPYVTNLFWYADRNATSGEIQYDNYGLFRLDYTAKPALRTLAVVNGVV